MPLCKDCGEEKDSTLFWKQNPRQCKSCQNIYNKKWKQKNKETLKIKNALYHEAHKEEISLRHKEYRAIKGEILNKKTKQWKQQNPGKVAIYNAQRDSLIKTVTPSWRNDFFIEEAYLLSKLRTEITGIEHHVDHIIPLKGKLVCGLHVETNLRVIPATLNLKKSNSFIIGNQEVRKWEL